MKRNSGITLIALIITIIVLLILAAVSVVALRDTNLFGRSQQATQIYNEARLDEEDKLAGYKYAIDEHTAGVPTINKLKENEYIRLEITTEDHKTATATVTKLENTDIDISGFKIMMAVGEGEDYEPSKEDWQETDTLEITEENSKVWASLYDGTKYGAEIFEIITPSIIDKVKPTGTVSFETGKEDNKYIIRTTIHASDEGSGLDFENCKYVFASSADPLGDNVNLYTDGSITTETTQINIIKPVGTYYLHVLLKDFGMNYTEVISENSVTLADNTAPTNDAPSVVLGDHKLTVTIQQSDEENGSGINKMYYKYGNSSGAGSYTEVTEKTFEITGLNSSSGDTQYIRTKVVDNAGREVESNETVQNLYIDKINVSASYASGTTYGVSTQSGGIYTRKIYLNTLRMACPNSGKGIGNDDYFAGSASVAGSSYPTSRTTDDAYTSSWISSRNRGSAPIAGRWSRTYTAKCPYCHQSYSFGYVYGTNLSTNNSSWASDGYWVMGNSSLRYNSSQILTYGPSHSNANCTYWTWDNPHNQNSGYQLYYYQQ